MPCWTSTGVGCLDERRIKLLGKAVVCTGARPAESVPAHPTYRPHHTGAVGHMA